MNAQEVFDTVCRHLYAQGKPAIMNRPQDVHPSCAYRGDNGTMCAVGCLIPQDEYQPSYEAKDAASVLIMAKRSKKARPVMRSLLPHEDLLTRLQRAHDECYNDYKRFDFSLLRQTLRSIANEFALDTSVLKTLKAR
jgi:hypothetical protein